jgi:RNA polymerase sigma-70 factor, ECF subfamily
MLPHILPFHWLNTSLIRSITTAGFNTDGINGGRSGFHRCEWIGQSPRKLKCGYPPYFLDTVLMSAMHPDADQWLQKLHDEYRMRLTYFAFRELRDWNEAEEIVGEGFVRIMNALPKITTWEHCLNTMYYIVRHIGIDILKVKERQRKMIAQYGQTIAISTEIVFKEGNERLLPIKDLPENMQAVIRLKYEGYTFDEIGSILNITKDAAKKRFSRAANILRATVEKS